MDPGLIGGLVLPVLGALPDSAMIVVSGLAGSIEEAKEQVPVPAHGNDTPRADPQCAEARANSFKAGREPAAEASVSCFRLQNPVGSLTPSP